jgi:hypothetical protein
MAKVSFGGVAGMCNQDIENMFAKRAGQMMDKRNMSTKIIIRSKKFIFYEIASFLQENLCFFEQKIHETLLNSLSGCPLLTWMCHSRLC